MSGQISARRVILTSFFVDVLDIVVNVAATFITGSVVMLSELFQGIADLIASGLLLVGLGRSRREVYFWSFLSALVMLVLAASLSFYFGLRRFLNPQEVHNILLAYVALSISVVSNAYAFFLSVKRILSGRSFSRLTSVFRDSPRVLTKNTFVLDLMGMSAALVGLVALISYQVFNNARFDGLGAMGIGVVLAFLSLTLIWDLRALIRKRSAKREV